MTAPKIWQRYPILKFVAFVLKVVKQISWMIVSYSVSRILLTHVECVELRPRTHFRDFQAVVPETGTTLRPMSCPNIVNVFSVAQNIPKVHYTRHFPENTVHITDIEVRIPRCNQRAAYLLTIGISLAHLK
jgi:hypothetical protein